MPSSVSEQKYLRLSILLSQREGCWVAECPELNTLVADPDIEIAWEDAVRVCRAHLAHGLNLGIDLRALIKPPPSDIAEIMAHARDQGSLQLQISPKFAGGPELTLHRLVKAA